MVRDVDDTTLCHKVVSSTSRTITIVRDVDDTTLCHKVVKHYNPLTLNRESR
jgi:hypothetical protein